ncbi:MAG: zf-HC2 domain-containing protein [Pyrinomonadaceae bacterium]|nr:zf-HC2 domain-containing protein [Pyrinomonadaceae bacterium]
MSDNLLCHQFEDLLSDYLENSLDKPTHRAVSAHVLRCPVCHEVLNAVKVNLQTCREITTPKPSLNLDARILRTTQPEKELSCAEFEKLLTDYLDGFLPAPVFHRWERHAVLCGECSDLPGAVVRTIGVCYTAKAAELEIPQGLNERILQVTLGTDNAKVAKKSFAAHARQAFEKIFAPFATPIFTPQFASVVMMFLLAFVVLSNFNNANAAENSIGNFYKTGVTLAEQTYKQSANAVGGDFTIEKTEPNVSDGKSQ